MPLHWHSPCTIVLGAPKALVADSVGKTVLADGCIVVECPGLAPPGATSPMGRATRGISETMAALGRALGTHAAGTNLSGATTSHNVAPKLHTSRGHPLEPLVVAWQGAPPRGRLGWNGSASGGT